MPNHPNRARAADARVVEKLIRSAEALQRVQELALAYALSKEAPPPLLKTRRIAALNSFDEARRKARARFLPATAD